MAVFQQAYHKTSLLSSEKSFRCTSRCTLVTSDLGTQVPRDSVLTTYLDRVKSRIDHTTYHIIAVAIAIDIAVAFWLPIDFRIDCVLIVY